jgi:PLP dependent protein
MDISQNIAQIKSSLPDGVKLVAVSKTMPPAIILEACRGEHRVFGENKAQELISKQEKLPNDIEWHFIGHLQTNKAKYIAPFVSMIQSIDSFKILKTVNREAEKNNRIIPCLLQFHIAQESTKFGFSEDEAFAVLRSSEFKKLNHIIVAGVMGMATFSDNESQVRKEFRHLKGIFNRLKKDFFNDRPEFKEISMGMSDDYLIAVDEGSTMVRIGSIIFGKRN